MYALAAPGANAHRPGASHLPAVLWPLFPATPGPKMPCAGRGQSSDHANCSAFVLIRSQGGSGCHRPHCSRVSGQELDRPTQAPHFGRRLIAVHCQVLSGSQASAPANGCVFRRSGMPFKILIGLLRGVVEGSLDHPYVLPSPTLISVLYRAERPGSVPDSGISPY